MVDDATIRFLRDPFVKTTIPRLHVKDGDVVAFCGDGCETAVRVPE